MKTITSTLQFAKEQPKAFAALPEAYQADDCLEFLFIDNYIVAKPKQDQIPALGSWEVYWTDQDHWLDADDQPIPSANG